MRKNQGEVTTDFILLFCISDIGTGFTVTQKYIDKSAELPLCFIKFQDSQKSCQVFYLHQTSEQLHSLLLSLGLQHVLLELHIHRKRSSRTH